MYVDHGSTSSYAIIGVLTALVMNVGLGLGLVYATSAGGGSMTEGAGEEPTVFPCRYVEDGRMHQIEVAAADWQEAETQVCGVQYKDVRVPPLLARGYARLVRSPESDPVLMAQRESCSCGTGEVQVIEDIGIVQAPKLGTIEKRRSLPQIVNNAEETEHNAVNPDEDPNKKIETKKDRKKDRKPDVSKLLDRTSNFDPARPTNDREAVGSKDGSRLSDGPGKGDVFLQKVKAQLDNNMNAPSSIPKSELKKLKAKVWLKIGTNGALWGWKFTRKSGNKAFDSMVERTLKRFEIGGNLKFAPPPQEWALKRISATIDGSNVK